MRGSPVLDQRFRLLDRCQTSNSRAHHSKWFKCAPKYQPGNFYVPAHIYKWIIILIHVHIHVYMHTHTYIHNKLGFDSRRPTPGGVYCETAVVCNQSVFLLDGLSYWTDEHHLPGATGFKAPVTRLMNPFLSVETGPPGLVTSHTRRPGVGLGC